MASHPRRQYLVTVAETIKCTNVYEIILYKLYNYYKFRPIMRPTSERCVAMDRHIVITQML